MGQHNIQIQPGILTVPATQHTNGGGDFDGHGPNMYLNLSLYVANEYQLGLNCSVRFQEVQSDWTTWQGAFTGIVYDVRTAGGLFKIASVVTPPFSDTKQLNGYDVHAFDYGVGGIVQHIDAIGDSDGGVFGGDDHPQVTITFNNIGIITEDPPFELAIREKWFATKIPLPRVVLPKPR